MSTNNFLLWLVERFPKQFLHYSFFIARLCGTWTYSLYIRKSHRQLGRTH